MKLPNKIRIGPSTYNLAIEPIDDFGKSDGDKNYIKVREGMTKEKTASTLLHEILHMILHEWHLDLPVKTEEKVTLAIESGLCSFAKDHRILFTNIIKDMGKE